MKTVYYAVGSGLGHLTRARRVLAALDLASEATIVTSSRDRDAAGDIPTIVINEDDDIGAVIGTAQRLIIDAFPCGIRGELAGIDAPRRDYVARRLRWSEYAPICATPAPRFDVTYVVEELEESHSDWVQMHSSAVAPLGLNVAPEAGKEEDFWLVVHSGPAEEVQELLAYARELAARAGATPRMMVATRCAMELPADVALAATSPQEPPPYAAAARIITAAGFNVMLETEAWKHKHHVLPFPRRFDDQFARARARKSSSQKAEGRGQK